MSPSPVEKRLDTDHHEGHRPLIMGILNATPDSFSDGGNFVEVQRALEQGLRMAHEGADIIDVGGESTRPGADPIPAEEQIRRIVPLISKLREALPSHVLISVDTTRSRVAESALMAGANWINDVSAGRDDAAMMELAADRHAHMVLMHMQGTPKTMQDDPRYSDVVQEVIEFLLERAAAAEEAGIDRERIVLDPGIGFGKRRDHNLALLGNLGRITSAGYPVLLGTSRKRFMGSLCNTAVPSELMPATVATTAIGVMAGVKVFRVHDVRENRQAVDVAYAIHDFELNPLA